MKKFLTLLTVVAMTFGLLTGCGKEEKLQDVGVSEITDYSKYVVLPDLENSHFTATAVEEVYTAETMEAELAYFATNNPKQVKVDRPAEKGDGIAFDFEGYMDDVQFEGGTGSTSLIIGSTTFFEEFEENLVGLEAGNSYDLNMHFPENYYEDLAGKPVLFKVTVQYVYVQEPAELNDEFAKEYFGTDTLDEFKETYLAYCQMQAEATTKGNGEDAAFEVILAASEVKLVPTEVISKYVEDLKAYYEEQAQGYGFTDLEQYCSVMGTNYEDMLATLQETAQEEGAREMVVRALAQQLGLTASDEEILDSAESYCTYYGEDITAEELIEQFGRDEFAYSVLYYKVLEKTLDYVDVTYYTETEE